MRPDKEERFSHVLTQFLEKECVIGDSLAISDEELFRHFVLFWRQSPEGFDHPALLGQFRVELTERGFRSDFAGKHPRWLGLTLSNPGKKKSEKKER